MSDAGLAGAARYNLDVAGQALRLRVKTYDYAVDDTVTSGTVRRPHLRSVPLSCGRPWRRSLVPAQQSLGVHGHWPGRAAAPAAAATGKSDSNLKPARLSLRRLSESSVVEGV